MRNLSKSFLILLVILMVVAIPISSVKAQAIIGTGLEVEKPEIYVVIHVDNNEINISEDLIRSKVELKLRQNDIKVLDKFDQTCILDVNLNMLSENKLLSIYVSNLELYRLVEYNTNNKTYGKLARVYKDGRLGRGEKEDIINTLEDATDVFINEFYKANDF